jgi:Tfp pilus assembly major pilin PilA
MMKRQKSFKKQKGLTLMELVIAIIVAIALGTGGLLIYSDLKAKARAANKADLSAKVSGAIVLYIAKVGGTLWPSGQRITSSDLMQNAICTDTGVTSGLISLVSDPTVTVQLLDGNGVPVANCASVAMGVSA